MSIDEAKEEATKVLKVDIAKYEDVELSETDTRCKLVDALLIPCMGWQEQLIQREPHVNGGDGYIDYLLHTSRPAYVIEAKRRSVQFALPSTKKGRAFKIGGVLSEDKKLKAAIEQCRDYGISKGTSFCCVTNGLQYVFFRSHSDLGVPFESHQAVIFDGPDDLLSGFSSFYNMLACEAVGEGRHFAALPVIAAIDTRIRFQELSAKPLGVRYKNRNRLEPFIRDVVSEVFQDLADDHADVELIEQCYVESASQGSYAQSLRGLLKNKPGLGDGGEVKPVRVARRSAGEFDNVLDAAGATKNRPYEVVMLLGGIGSGKTTFIRRFQKVIAREKIEQQCLWIDVNFNKYSDSPSGLDQWVAARILAEAEDNYPELGFGSYTHLRQAYHSEYERLKRGRLAPIHASDPDEFERRFSLELANYEAEAIPHVIRLLRSAQQQFTRRVFLVFDNADQYDAAVQDSVFMLAHRLASEVGCSLIVSLREESYWKNKDYGALSAFHSVNFYVEAPDLKQVIAKRFRYATDLLRRQQSYVVPSGGLGVTAEEGVEIFDRIRSTVLDDGRFVQFLESLSPGEIRRPLDQLARFLYSGHTNVDSIIRGIRTYTTVRIGFHEFVKSVALGDRELFDEKKSDIVNLFALSGAHDASNLNRLAVLGYIHRFRRDKSERGLGYVPFNQVVDACVSYGLAADTVQEIIQFSNARRVLETDQQIREAVSPSWFVRTTRAFDYYLDNLAETFIYVDLVLPGTIVPQSEYANMIERMSSQIYGSGVNAPNRLDKIQLRIDRARCFAMFLAEEAGHHGMFRAGAVHEPVSAFVMGLDRSLERQTDAIRDNARKAFAASGATARRRVRNREGG